MTPEEREKKIEAICAAMDDWDLETLLYWAKGARGVILMKCEDDELEVVYQDEVVGPPERRR